MADCVAFRLYVGDQISALVPLLLNQMRQKGVAVSGDHQNGSISVPTPIGTIEATFQTSGKSLIVSISHRPESISCGTIESKVQDFLLDAKALLKSRK